MGISYALGFPSRLCAIQPMRNRIAIIEIVSAIGTSQKAHRSGPRMEVILEGCGPIRLEKSEECGEKLAQHASPVNGPTVTIRNNTLVITGVTV